MSIELVPLGHVRITISANTMLEGVPSGGRLIGEASACEWESDRVRASQRGTSASDWVQVMPGGGVAVDARILLETDDGALICLRYTGRAAGLPAEGHPVITAPTFETNSPRYAWLNTVQAIAKGRRDGQTLVYEMYEVA